MLTLTWSPWPAAPPGHAGAASSCLRLVRRGKGKGEWVIPMTAMEGDGQAMGAQPESETGAPDAHVPCTER